MLSAFAAHEAGRAPKISRPVGQDLGPADMGEGGWGGEFWAGRGFVSGRIFFETKNRFTICAVWNVVSFGTFCSGATLRGTAALAGHSLQLPRWRAMPPLRPSASLALLWEVCWETSSEEGP